MASSIPPIDHPPTPARRCYRWLIALASVGCAAWISAMMIPPQESSLEDGPAVGQQSPQLNLTPICDPLTRPVSLGSFATFADDDLAASTDLDLQCLSARAIPMDQGSVSLVHFWGTWCGPCREEMPDMARLYQDFKFEEHFQFICISCCMFDDASLDLLRSRTQAFYANRDIDLPTYADPHYKTRDSFLMLMNRPCMAYPTTILIDGKGVIRGTWIGVPRDGTKTIRSSIQQLLNEDA